MSGKLPHPASSIELQLMSANANGDQNDDYAVDSHIVELSESIDREIRSNTGHRCSSQEETIFRLPKPSNERLHHSAAADKMMSTYQPALLSIGPYHVNATEELRCSEQRKLSALDEQIPQGGRPSVLDYTRAAKSMEEKARRCYEGDVGMDPDAFSRMLLLDAFQVILHLKYFGWFVDITAAASPGAAETASPSPSQGCSIRTQDLTMTIHDLLMLENQIPFFVVEKIYELQNNGNAATPLRRIAWEAISYLVGGGPSSPPKDLQSLEFQHLVHVCHVYFKPTCLKNIPASRENSEQETGTYGRFRRATEYYEAGVTFRKWCPEAADRRRPLLDVAFNNGVLSVALQDIDEKIGYILRNVLAYEQKYHGKATTLDTSYVTAYVVFMSQLLGSADDVALLSRRRVVERLLGDDAELCALFRGLADGLAFHPGSENYLSPVEEALQAHCRCRRYRWRAWIVRHRFGNPWLVAAWLFGGSAVLGTIIQTVFTVLAYVKPRH